MRKEVITIVAIILLLLAGAGFLFVKYVQQKTAVYYAEKESKLYRYYYDYYYAHNKRFSATEFLKVLSHKDPELYELRQNRILPQRRRFCLPKIRIVTKFCKF